MQVDDTIHMSVVSIKWSKYHKSQLVNVSHLSIFSAIFSWQGHAWIAEGQGMGRSKRPGDHPRPWPLSQQWDKKGMKLYETEILIYARSTCCNWILHSMCVCVRYSRTTWIWRCWVMFEGPIIWWIILVLNQSTNHIMESELSICQRWLPPACKPWHLATKMSYRCLQVLTADRSIRTY